MASAAWEKFGTRSQRSMVHSPSNWSVTISKPAGRPESFNGSEKNSSFQFAALAHPACLLHRRGRDPPFGQREFGHGRGCKQALTRFGQPASPARRPRNTRAVGGDSGVSVHLPVNLRDQNKSQPGAHGLDEPGTRPNVFETVKSVPDGLRAPPNLFRGHGRMRPVELGPKRSWYEPATGDGNAGDVLRGGLHVFLPAVEIHGAGIWSQHDKLGKRNFGAGCGQGSGIERFRTIAGQTKDERTEHI